MDGLFLELLDTGLGTIRYDTICVYHAITTMTTTNGVLAALLDRTKRKDGDDTKGG
jgi:hypothetical protein